MSTRFATDHDVEQIRDLVECAYRGEQSRLGWTTEEGLLGGQRTDEDEILSHLRRSDTRILLGERRGTLVASILLRCEGQEGYVGMFAVRPTEQGQRIGRELLAAAEQVLREQMGATAVRMTVLRQRQELIAWYARRGYQSTNEREPFPYDNPRMGLPKRQDLEFIVLKKSLGGETIL